MEGVIFRGVMIPFLGTSLGAAMVIFMKSDPNAPLYFTRPR